MTQGGGGSHTGRNVGIAVVALVVIVGAAFALLGGGSSNSALAPKTVTVTGTISASGSGTHATEVQFTDTSGTTHSTQVSGGQFTISLANPGAYSVQVMWAGAYSWQGGTVNVSNPLDLNVGVGGPSSQTETITVSTPDSDIQVSGTAATKGLGTHPVSIAFTDSNGIAYTAQVNNGVYSITLPNTMNYSVEITGQGALGYSGSCGAGQLSVNNSAGNDGLQVGQYSC